MEVSPVFATMMSDQLSPNGFFDADLHLGTTFITPNKDLTAEYP